MPFIVEKDNVSISLSHKKLNVYNFFKTIITYPNSFFIVISSYKGGNTCVTEEDWKELGILVKKDSYQNLIIEDIDSMKFFLSDSINFLNLAIYEKGKIPNSSNYSYIFEIHDANTLLIFSPLFTDLVFHKLLCAYLIAECRLKKNFYSSMNSLIRKNISFDDLPISINLILPLYTFVSLYFILQIDQNGIKDFSFNQIKLDSFYSLPLLSPEPKNYIHRYMEFIYQNKKQCLWLKHIFNPFYLFLISILFFLLHLKILFNLCFFLFAVSILVYIIGFIEKLYLIYKEA